jgi:predicted SAM-dependent methyltransferase
MTYKICIKCGEKQPIPLDINVNLICQKCGGNWAEFTSQIQGQCQKCELSETYCVDEVYNTCHNCLEGDSYFMEFPSRNIKISQQNNKNLTLTEGSLKIVMPYYEGGRRVNRALNTWLYKEVVFAISDPFIIPPGSGICSQFQVKKSSKLYVNGSDKNLPMFPDILKTLILIYPNEDYYGVVNSDIILPPGTSPYSLLPSKDKIIAIHHRLDLKGEDWNKIREMKKAGIIIVGKDGFIFTRKVAKAICKYYPEMVIGIPFWDTALSIWLWDKYGENKIDFCYREIYHVYHKSGQEAVDQYNTLEGKFNKKQASQIFSKNYTGDIWKEVCSENKSKRKDIQRKIKAIIQPGRLGDILICLPIAKYYFDRGYKIIWPVHQQYIELFDRIPYVEAISLPKWKNIYTTARKIVIEKKVNSKDIIDLAIGFGRDEKDWRESGFHFDEYKYMLANVPFEEKYNLVFNRNTKKEKALCKELELEKYHDGYVVTHSKSSFAEYDFKIPSAIEVEEKEGYLIFDWLTVLEGARYIFCVDSCIANLVNQLGIANGRRYFRDWKDIRDKKEARRLTPMFNMGYVPYRPVKYKGRDYPQYINDNNAASHVINKALQYCKGEGIDLGGGENPFPGAKNLDVKMGVEINYIVHGVLEAEKLDYIFSSHFLEHVIDVKAVLKECFKSLKENGILFLYLPHPENEYWHPSNPAMKGKYGHKHKMEVNKVIRWLEKIGFVIKEISNFIPDHYFSYYIIAEKLVGSKLASKKAKNKSFLASKYPKVSFILIVYNGMPWIEYALKAIEDYAHEIVIVEGAIRDLGITRKSQCASSDGTLEFLSEYIKKNDKTQIYFNRGDLDKKGMQNFAMQECTGRYVWLVDYDEIWRYKDIEKVMRLLKKPDIAQINFMVINFFKGFDYILDGGQKYKKLTSNVSRIFRRLKNNSFKSHRPPKLEHKVNGEIFSGQDIEYACGVKLLHFSYMTNKQIDQKIVLYENIYDWQSHKGMADWQTNFFRPWKKEDEIRLLQNKTYGAWIGDRDTITVRYRKTLPEVFDSRILEKFKK